MLFGVAFIFSLFVVPSAGDGDRDPELGEIVEVQSSGLGGYVSCRYIPRSPSQALPAFYSIAVSTPIGLPRIPIGLQFL